MKKALFFSFVILFLFELRSQDYLIEFAGTGTGTIDSVQVENLTQGSSLTLSGADVLYLRAIVSDIKTFDYAQYSDMRLYPNPVTEKCKVELDVMTQNNYVVEIFNVAGQLVAHQHAVLSQGIHAWEISGLNRGLYDVSIKSAGHSYHGKIISLSQHKESTQISYLGQSASSYPLRSLKNTGSPVQMQYNEGDRLKFTAFHGYSRTLLTDVPTGNKTVAFHFAECIDGDNNTYTAVQIGDQLWMAENLKTTRYKDGTEIPLVTNDSSWRALQTPAYCWYNNDSAMYSQHYGALYTWYTFSEGNLCPAGWHMPSTDDWTKLVAFLKDNGYGFEGNREYYSKSLAATSGWETYAVAGTVGNDQSSNNYSGFSALPAGYRYFDGTFKDMGISGNWWSYNGNEPDCFALYWQLGFNSLEMYNYKIEREYGYAVRCLKD